MPIMLKQDDERIAFVFQGVQQLCDGRAFRQARLRDGSVAMVEEPDSRRYEVTKGTFSDNTKHVEVVEPDGTRKRAGGAYAV